MTFVHGRLLAALRQKMTQKPSSAVARTAAICRQMSSGSPTPVDDAEVVFESNLALRAYHLNRPKKLNSLNENMLNLLRSKIQVLPSVYLRVRRPQ